MTPGGREVQPHTLTQPRTLTHLRHTMWQAKSTLTKDGGQQQGRLMNHVVLELLSVRAAPNKHSVTDRLGVETLKKTL